MNRKHQVLKAQWLDPLLVLLVVIIVGSTCSLILLRDLGRYWSSIGKKLEMVGAPVKPGTGEAVPEGDRGDAPGVDGR